MSPFDTPEIPNALRLQWMHQTGFELEELSSLYSTLNQIHIPILNMEFFCQLAIPEGRAAKTTDELRLRVKNSIDEQLQLLYSLMKRIYCDSYDPSKIVLQKGSSAYVRSACVSSSLQALTEALCKTVYSPEEAEKPSPELDGDVDDDNDEDEESDFTPETQYLPTAYEILDDCSGDELVGLGKDCRVEDLGQLSVPSSPGRIPPTSPTSNRSVKPSCQMEKCDSNNSACTTSPLDAAGQPDRQENSLLVKKRKRSDEDGCEGRNILKQNRSKSIG